MNWLKATLRATILVTFSVSCDPNSHAPSNHPCNFPDADTESGLRDPYSFKIIDSQTHENLVGIDPAFPIHPDSVVLYDDSWNPIDPEPIFDVGNEWLFQNFRPYSNVPFNDAQALLNLDKRSFYLKIKSQDIDTIEVNFKQCIIEDVRYNGHSAEQPSDLPLTASFYFTKQR